MNTTTWTLWMLAAVALCSVSPSLPQNTIILAALLILSKLLGVEPKNYLKTALVFSIPLILVNVLFVHAGEHKIAEIPPNFLGMPLPFIAGPITLESVYAGLLFTLLLANMLVAFAVYQNQTTQDNIIRAMPESLSHSAVLTAVALRFIPTLAQDVASISEANRSRGLKIEGASFAQKTKNNSTLLVPSLVNALERSYNLAEALESRGYGGKRSRYQTEAWTRTDKTLAATYAAVIALAVYLAASGSTTSWGDFRLEKILDATKTTAPLAAAAACLLLPGVRRWTQ